MGNQHTDGLELCGASPSPSSQKHKQGEKIERLELYAGMRSPSRQSPQYPISVTIMTVMMTQEHHIMTQEQNRVPFPFPPEVLLLQSL